MTLRSVTEPHFMVVVRPFNTYGLWAALVGTLLLALYLVVGFIFLDVADLLGGWMDVFPLLGIFSYSLVVILFAIHFKQTNQNTHRFRSIPIPTRNVRQSSDSEPMNQNE